jgi:hypothetical protein
LDTGATLDASATLRIKTSPGAHTLVWEKLAERGRTMRNKALLFETAILCNVVGTVVAVLVCVV